MTTDVSICTSALLLVGADEIESFVDETREAKLCAQIYPTIKKKLLQSYPWKFAKGQAQLAQLVAVPVYDYDHAYQLPAGFLKMEEVNSPTIRYKIIGDKVYTDADELSCTFIFDPGEENYPEYFSHLIELNLAALLSVALLEDLPKGREFRALFKDQKMEARSTDSQGEPTDALDEVNFELTQVRY